MRLPSRSIRSVAAVAIATGIAGCGSSSIKGALTPSANKRIASELSAVSDAVNGTSCGGARTALAQLDSTLAGLPASTNAGLVSNLKQGATTLKGLALKECHGTKVTTTSTTSSTTTTTTTSTTVPTTTSTPTTTSATVTQTQTQTQTNTVPGTGGVTSLPSTPSTPTPPAAGSSGTATGGAGGLGGG